MSERKERWKRGGILILCSVLCCLMFSGLLPKKAQAQENLKNGYVRRTDDAQTGEIKYDWYLTPGDEGLISWRSIARILAERGYRGDICLTAEYTQEDKLLTYLKRDIAYLKELGISI